MPIPHLKQGTLDGLCGVYALLNALFQRIYHSRSLCYEHRDEHFKTAIGCLPQKALVDAIINGLTCDQLLKLSNKFLKGYKATANTGDYTVRAERPFQDQKFKHRIDFHSMLHSIYEQPGTAAIIGISYRSRSRMRDESLYKSGHWVAVRAVNQHGFDVVNNSAENFISKNFKAKMDRSQISIDYNETIILKAVQC